MIYKLTFIIFNLTFLTINSWGEPEKTDRTAQLYAREVFEGFQKIRSAHKSNRLKDVLNSNYLHKFDSKDKAFLTNKLAMSPIPHSLSAKLNGSQIFLKSQWSKTEYKIDFKEAQYDILEINDKKIEMHSSHNLSFKEYFEEIKESIFPKNKKSVSTFLLKAILFPLHVLAACAPEANADGAVAAAGASAYNFPRASNGSGPRASALGQPLGKQSH